MKFTLFMIEMFYTPILRTKLIFAVPQIVTGKFNFFDVYIHRASPKLFSSPPDSIAVVLIRRNPEMYDYYA